jgi:reversibly glycosylated polypeptide/UDP-arabinopyranose mutase
MTGSIAVVVPTIRPETMLAFKAAWQAQFERHNARLIEVKDGAEPTVNGLTAHDLLGADADLICNRTDAVRNLGFAYIAKCLPEIEIVVTLDDDTRPCGDTIGDHLDALARCYPLSWMSTASEYVRGVPYAVRDEAECAVSHGVWHGVADWDAPTQLIRGNPPVTFYKGAIPLGVLFPFCGMNVAFHRRMLPWMYWAPMGPRFELDRFGDIWLGIHLKRLCDERGWAIATGYSAVRHERASNVFKNLQKEARGLEMNETYWQEEESTAYGYEYRAMRERWAAVMR